MNAKQRTIYDKMRKYYTASGLSPSAAKVFAWLTVCEPAAQTAEQIQAETGVSAGGVSEATIMLEKVKVVTRYRRAGERRYYYEITPAGFVASIEQRIAMSLAIRDMASEAIEVLPGNERLHSMHRLYDLLALRLPAIIDEYRQDNL